MTTPLLRPLPLAPWAAGRMFLSAMPGRVAPLAAYRAAVAGIDRTLCLTSAEEIAAKSPDYAAALIAGDWPGRWTAAAVPDFGVPADEAGFAAALAGAATTLLAGEALLLHCAAGIGRTGAAALCLLHLLGAPPAEAEARVEAAGSHPETEAQRDFVARFLTGQSPGRIPAA